MSQLDIKALESNFSNWRQERAPQFKSGPAFERYSAELVLKDADLSDEEIASGLTGAGDDGGVDAMYFFVNRSLMTEESKLPQQVYEANLWIIQAKYEKGGFGEDVVGNMQLFIADILDFSKPISSFNYYNQKLKDAMTSFREKYEAIIGRPHKFSIDFVYTAKTDEKPHPKVTKRVENLASDVKALISSATFNFSFWGARELTEAFRSPPNKILALDIVKSFMADDGSVVCLSRLDKFAQFLTDENGRMRQYVLEPNVRDYQGERNPVNSDIRATLASGEVKEFWWLNNGITIIADKCSVAASKVEITSPELVNGLQTSYEIFNYFHAHKNDDGRTVLVRVIIPPDDQTRRRIIKATNSQTTVSPLSLRVTEDIHFDIEELFKLYNLYYDRRKGEYRRLRKPISRIISIKDVAQAVMAVVLQRPDDARARPLTRLGTEEGYSRVFDASANRELFLVSVLLDKQVDAYLGERDDIPKDVHNDIQFYMDTWLASELTRKPSPTQAEIVALGPFVKAPLDKIALDKCCDEILLIYNRHGADSRAAKGSQMREAVLKTLEAKFLDQN